MDGQHLVPVVIEKTGRGERAYDIYSRLLKDRIVFVGGGIDDEVANLVIAQMLYLGNESPHEDINLYINSPGGSVSAGLAIYDTMQYLRCDVATYCVGLAASMAAVLLAAGTKGKRNALPNSRVLLHQPLLPRVITGPAADLEIEAREMIRLRERLYAIIAQHTSQATSKIEKDCDRNLWMTAAEAVGYGICDRAIEKIPPQDVERRPAAEE